MCNYAEWCLLLAEDNTKALTQVSNLVSHYGHVIHTQVVNIYSHLSNGLSCVCVEEDSGMRSLFIYSSYPLADLFDWLRKQLGVRLDR